MVKSIIPRSIRKLTNLPNLAPQYIRMFEEFREFGGYRKVAELRRVMQLAIIGEDFSTEFLPKDLIPDSWTKKQYFNPTLRKYLANPAEDGVPFRNFADDPDVIFQIKNFFNALYHIEESLKDLESLKVDQYGTNLTYFFKDFDTVYNNTIDHTYEAAILLTNLHPEFVSVFAPEITKIMEYANWMKDELVSLQENKESRDRVEEVVSYLSPHTAGKITGIAIEQMGNNSKQIDFTFVTQMLTRAPEYIDKLTQLIDKYAKGLEEVEPNIDPDDIQRLRDDAVHIINGLDDLYNSSRLLMPFKVLRYIRMLKRVVQVSNDIIEQVNYANESSQEGIRLKMHELKYQHIQALFEEADKIEEFGLLKQGLVTDTMMESLDNLYDTLSFYVGMVLEFSEKGQDLEHLDDHCLRHGRIDALQLRIEEDQAKLQNWADKKNALEAFYKILLNPEYSEKKLTELSGADRTELCKIYPKIQDYVKKYDIYVHVKIVDELYPDIKIPKSYWEKTKDIYYWLRGNYGMTFATFKTLKPDIERVLNREKATLEFQLHSHQDAIEKISKRNVRLSPWNSERTVFAVNEQSLLGLDENNSSYQIKKDNHTTTVSVQKPNSNGYDLKSSQARRMVFHYKTKITELNDAIAAYKRFMATCLSKKTRPLNLFSEDDKNALLKDFLIFQPWLYVLEDNETKQINKLDSKILMALKKDTTSVSNDDIVSGKSIFLATKHVFGKLNDVEKTFQNRQNYWHSLGNTIRRKEDDLLRVDVTSQEVLNRTGYLIPDANISNKIAEYRLSLSDFLNAFSPAMQLELRSPVAINLKNSLTNWSAKDINNFKQQSIPLKTELLASVQALNNNDKLPDEAVDYLKELQPDLWRSLNVGTLKLFLRMPADQLVALKEQKALPLHKREFHLVSAGAWNIPWYASKSQIPYPEMLDEVLVQAQPKQVAALKNLYNGFFHMEKIFAQLEKLNNGSSKSLYCYHLLMTYSHIIEMYNLSLGLYNDPQYRFLAREAMVRLQEIYGYIKPELEAYQTDSETLTEIETPVNKNAFWYAMNALLVLPEHIQAKRHGEDIDPKKLKQLQVQAKKNVTNIERIIDKSDSYFQLFLESPTMVRLFFEMRKRIKDLTYHSHTAAIENLKEINTVGFLKVLEEADLWEQRLGLEPGMIANPLENMLSQFYQGMISALDLESEQEFDLLFNFELVGQRKASVMAQVQKAESELSNISSFEKDMQILYNELSEFKDDYEDKERHFMYVAELIRKHESRMVEELNVIAFKKALLEFNDLLEKSVAANSSTTTKIPSESPNPDSDIDIRLMKLFEQFGKQIVDACQEMAKQTRTQALLEIPVDKPKQEAIEALVQSIVKHNLSKTHEDPDKSKTPSSKEFMNAMQSILPTQTNGEVSIASALRYLAAEYAPQMALLEKRTDLQPVTNQLFQYIDEETNEKNQDLQTWFNVEDYLSTIDAEQYSQLGKLFSLLQKQKTYYDGFSFSNAMNLFTNNVEIQTGFNSISNLMRSLLPEYTADQMDATVFKRTLTQLYKNLLSKEAFRTSLMSHSNVDTPTALDNWQELFLNPAYDQSLTELYARHFVPPTDINATTKDTDSNLASQKKDDMEIWCEDDDIPMMNNVEEAEGHSQEKLAYIEADKLFTSVEQYHRIYSKFPSDRPEIILDFERNTIKSIESLLPQFNHKMGKDAFDDGLLKLYKAYIAVKGPEAGEQTNANIFSRMYGYLFPTTLENQPRQDENSIKKPAFFKAFDSIYYTLAERSKRKEIEETTLPKTNQEIRFPGLFAYLRATYGQKVSTLTMQQSICQEQIDHFSRLESEQKQQRSEYKERYIQSKYESGLNELLFRELGLTSQRAEYRDNLRTYIESHKQTAIENVRNSKDIQKAMSMELESLNRRFEIAEFRKHAHLEVIRKALEDMLINYILPQDNLVHEDRSIFEDKVTLGIKKAFLAELLQMADNTELSVSERIEGMSNYVKEVEKNHTGFFNQKRFKNYGFSWLKQFCYYLLSIIGLYTPAAKKHYNTLLSKASLETEKFALPKERTFFGSTMKQKAQSTPPSPDKDEESGPGIPPAG